MGDLLPFPNAGGAAPEPKTPLYPTMFCAGCGADRTVGPTAADPGPCPSCGSTMRSSSAGPVGASVGDIFGHPA